MIRLWCPTLAHYDDSGALDLPRMRAHQARLLPHVGGFLIPGSTGDGWQMDEAMTDDIVAFARAQAATTGVALLVGALRPTLAGILDRIARLPEESVAVTVCAPHGDLSQETIADALGQVLALGRPTALYQLPQVTGNRIAPETIAALAARFANFALFKDTSGEDTVARAGLDYRQVKLVRGAEGDYATWLKPAGPYDGFLLSTANSFPAELRRIVDDPAAPESLALSARVSAVVAAAFAAVADVPHGNAFANANKALDHVFAHGPDALSIPPPVLHGGARLPVGAVAAARDALERHGLLPEHGYLPA